MITIFRGFLLINFLLISFLSRSQDRCGTVPYNQHLNQIHKSRPSEKVFEHWLNEKIKERKLKSQINGLRRSLEEVYVLPVVVHVIHNGEEIGVGTNISDEQIFSQIEVLNEDFRRLNPDTVNTPDIFKSVAGDAGIEFRLSVRDPEGNATHGIVRVQGIKSSWDYYRDDELLKSQSFWPPEDYLNIWVCNINILGYAQYPVTDLPGVLPPFDRETDGVVIDYKAFGSVTKGDFPNLQKNYDLGRTTTHEMGHFLSLRHIWGDCGCGCDDYCDDTPIAEDSYFSCDNGEPYSCGSRDMYENFLDYTYDRCMNIFTQDQRVRMRIVLENSPRRHSLLSSMALIPTEGFENDLYAREILAPADISCNVIQSPTIMIQNVGKNTINTYKIEYRIDSQIYPDVIVDQSLDPLETTQIELPGIELSEAEHHIYFLVKEPNGVEDANPRDNTLEKAFLINSEEDFLPYRNRFSDGSIEASGWSTYNPDQLITWELKAYQKDFTEEFAAAIDLYNYSTIGQEDWLISPVFDFSDINEASVFYDYSYASNKNYLDKLEILVSTNCGTSFPYLLYSAYSDELAITTSEKQWRPKLATDWARNQVLLSDFSGSKEVRIGFKTTNGSGNTLFLDNIEFFLSEESDPVIPEVNTMTIYPNPTLSSQFSLVVNLDKRGDIVISIMDLTGKNVFYATYQNTLNQTFPFDLAGNRAGMYLIKAAGNNFSDIQKLIIIP